MDYCFMRLFDKTEARRRFFMRYLDAYVWLIYNIKNVNWRWPFWPLQKAEYAMMFGIISAIVSIANLVAANPFCLFIYLLYPVCLFVASWCMIKGIIPIHGTFMETFRQRSRPLPLWALFFGTKIRLQSDQLFNGGPDAIREWNEWFDNFCSTFITSRIALPFILQHDEDGYYYEVMFLNRDDAVHAKLLY